MDRHDYMALCRNASALLGVPDVERLGIDGEVVVEGETIGIVFDESEDAERIFCYVGLCTTDRVEASHRPLDIYRDLLSFNLLTGSKTSGVIALEPDSSQLTLVVHILVNEFLDADQMVHILRESASNVSFLRDLVSARLTQTDARKDELIPHYSKA